MIQAGVSCFKIEGRLKGPEYVALTTKVGGSGGLGLRGWCADGGGDECATHKVPTHTYNSNP